MLTSKRQEWILQMIKGPDITPVGNSPGHYTSKSTITITANEKQVTIRPSDVLKLSNPQCLIVQANGSECEIPWDRISNLDFDFRAYAGKHFGRMAEMARDSCYGDWLRAFQV